MLGIMWKCQQHFRKCLGTFICVLPNFIPYIIGSIKKTLAFIRINGNIISICLILYYLFLLKNIYTFFESPSMTLLCRVQNGFADWNHSTLACCPMRSWKVSKSAVVILQLKHKEQIATMVCSDLYIVTSGTFWMFSLFISPSKDSLYKYNVILSGFYHSTHINQINGSY